MRYKDSMRLTSTVNSVEFEAENLIHEQLKGHSMLAPKAQLNYKEQFKSLNVYQQKNTATKNKVPNMGVQFSSKPLNTYYNNQTELEDQIRADEEKPKADPMNIVNVIDFPNTLETRSSMMMKRQDLNASQLRLEHHESCNITPDINFNKQI